MKQSNEIYKLPLPDGLIGTPFRQLLNDLIEYQVIPVGITRIEMSTETKQLKPREEFIINPEGDKRLRRGDNILVIAFSEPNIELLLSQVSNEASDVGDT